MVCPCCQESVQFDWYFCRWCGAALAPSMSVAIADRSLIDSIFNGLLVGNQLMQAQAKQAEEARKYSAYQPGEAALAAANSVGMGDLVAPNL